ncbi:tRNA glutamyl-Q(34) synthetase GluQRS [Schaalia sp. ZJ405]|uniref:tRNA glutamyl-Q(34) synthetase GluQRS n=1 Tax=Schaalia sp. ZJ405 TaxID=2709403 RepID=UPI0013EBD305|nr:tRNA glutamyl-Q(34) synthetase GluQRS [Schaalia sp. ZJ405]QPK82143.1 tRNA glutamyl-Q(34) synthetase GluQRS [Schaalia sp. ZJ405]
MVGAGRFAPSPTGDFHLGNLRTAILAWSWARLTDRRFLIRMEDIDAQRSTDQAAQRQLEDLDRIGLDWDGPVLVQTTRAEAHRRALATLHERGLVFECYCTRKDIREAASAPHVPAGHYPGTCLHLNEDERQEKREQLAELGRAPALRFRAPRDQWTVVDELAGEYAGTVDHFVVQRADGVPAYNLAATVDDAFEGIDQVVRGDDLLAQSPGQAALLWALGAPEPTYVHVPLAVNSSGERLAKRDGAVTLAELTDEGWSVGDVVEWIGESLGVSRARCAADIAEALGIEGLRAMSRDPWVVVPPRGRRR